MANSALRSRNFVLLVLGQVTSLLGNLSLRFALSMYILEATGSATLFSGLLALSMAPTILLSPFGGMLADRADRRKVMVALDALSGLLVLLAGLALPWGTGFRPLRRCCSRCRSSRRSNRPRCRRACRRCSRARRCCAAMRSSRRCRRWPRS